MEVELKVICRVRANGEKAEEDPAQSKEEKPWKKRCRLLVK
jgi:hypothetical protein